MGRCELYGTVWSTTSGGQPEGTSIADSAYGIEGLPLHTDMTYHRDPPGLQIFTMVQPAGDGGGESIFCDGFAAADRLRKINPEAFVTLSETSRRYRGRERINTWKRSP
jgi:alpha-ketoglutarate-dependent taurine dioxygenase